MHCGTPPFTLFLTKQSSQSAQARIDPLRLRRKQLHKRQRWNGNRSQRSVLYTDVFYSYLVFDLSFLEKLLKIVL
ncbi:hypothetical protein N665_0276s0003 [Sinapis alba]|nr:hypothetical protein N665_0276s0003 [Sinapis alba]